MKTSADIIVLHKCNKTNDHRLYCSWDMVFDGCNCCFLFWAIFCPFTPLTAQRWKFQKTKKKHQGISSFYTSVPKIILICYTVHEIWHVTHVIIIFNFGLFFALLPPLQTKIKISKKNEKKLLEISSFYTCVPKIMIRWGTVPEIWWKMDGWTNSWTDGKRDI